MHLDHLQTPFSGRPGLELLALYYQKVREGWGGCGYVALQEGQIVGYTCGIWDGQTLRKNLISSAWFKIGFWAAMQAVIRPIMVLDLVRRFTQPKSKQAETTHGYELRPIVVSPEARGSGVAVQLVDALMHDAAGRGYPYIYLYTKLENSRANAFYRKTGFHSVGQELRSGQVYCRYERSTGKQP